MTKLIWLPESPEDDSLVTPCLAAHAGHWSSAPLPALGEPAIAVVPASLYQWHVISLPKLPRGKWQAAAASIIEPRLLDEMERMVFHVEPRASDGTHAVAVFDREWVSRAQDWLGRKGLAPQRWVPETSLLPAGEGRWVLYQRRGEWVLARSRFEHCVLDVSSDSSAPLMMRAALDAHGMPVTCMVASLAEPPQLAERYQPEVPLWLATLGLRATVAPGTEWLVTPSPREANFSPSGSTRRQFHLPELGRWKKPALLAGLLLGLHGAGLAAQYLQWRSEAQGLQQSIRETTTALERESTGSREPASHVALATLMNKLPALSLTPPNITRLEFDGSQLIVELDPKRVKPDELAPRIREAGGTLITPPTGAAVVRFTLAAGGRS
ncbi:MAG: hypothetical protein RIR70_1090 [Pseudomonadota bacterium]